MRTTHVDQEHHEHQLEVIRRNLADSRGRGSIRNADPTYVAVTIATVIHNDLSRIVDALESIANAR